MLARGCGVSRGSRAVHAGMPVVCSRPAFNELVKNVTSAVAEGHFLWFPGIFVGRKAHQDEE